MLEPTARRPQATFTRYHPDRRAGSTSTSPGRQHGDEDRDLEEDLDAGMVARHGVPGGAIVRPASFEHGLDGDHAQPEADGEHVSELGTTRRRFLLTRPGCGVKSLVRGGLPAIRPSPCDAGRVVRVPRSSV
jgi:hypothetical protein